MLKQRDMKKELRTLAKTVFFTALGSAILAFDFYSFYLPNGLMMGGASGVGLLLFRTLRFDPSVTVFILNAVLLLAGALIVGRQFFISTALGSLLYPVFLKLFQSFPQLAEISHDRLLCTLVAAALDGVAVAMVIKVGGSTGGSDAFGVIWNKLFHHNVATVIAIADMLIFLAQLLFAKPEIILYSLISVVINMVAIRQFLTLGTVHMQIIAVSQKSHELREALIEKMDAGVTMLESRTGFEDKPGKVVLCVLPRKKLWNAVELIKSIDESAFLSVAEVKEVHGRGFTMERVVRPQPLPEK